MEVFGDKRGRLNSKCCLEGRKRTGCSSYYSHGRVLADCSFEKSEIRIGLVFETAILHSAQSVNSMFSMPIPSLQAFFLFHIPNPFPIYQSCQFTSVPNYSKVVPNS